MAEKTLHHHKVLIHAVHIRNTSRQKCSYLEVFRTGISCETLVYLSKSKLTLLTFCFGCFATAGASTMRPSTLESVMNQPTKSNKIWYSDTASTELE